METRESFIGNNGFFTVDSQYTSENANNFTVDELLDFSKQEDFTADDFIDCSAVTAVDSCNSSVSGGSAGGFDGSLFAGNLTDAPELFVPYDELAELEWLSNFVEESKSFSSDEAQNLQLIFPAKISATAADSSSSATTDNHSPPALTSDAYVTVPGKARSKRSRIAPCDWSSRLLSPPSELQKPGKPKRRESSDINGRKCLHCASEKTPQWRTGPMGPKTLCNACGVRYKSGRLVPEYRPAASPTFVSAKHSNSHRKVLELRRQKEAQMHHHHPQQLMHTQQPPIFAGAGGDGYLLHHHQQRCGPVAEYGHMI